MKSLITSLLFISAFVRLSSAQEIPNGPWTDLFNGENLDGWEYSNDPPWHVKDGLLQVSGGEKTHLIWPEPLINFEFTLRYRLTTNYANNSVLFRSVCSRGEELPNCDESYLLCGPKLYIDDININHYWC